MAGVDIMVTKGDLAKNPKNCLYYIIEIMPRRDWIQLCDYRPWLQKRKWKRCILKVLKALGKKD